MAHLVGVFLVFTILSYTTVDSETRGAVHQPQFNVGYQILELKYRKDREEKTFTVAVRMRTGQEGDFNRLGRLQHAKQIAGSGPGDRGKYLYRLDEIRLVQDGMLTSDAFGELIDRDRIAVGGHSFG